MKNHHCRHIDPYDLVLHLFTTEKSFHRYLKQNDMPPHTIADDVNATTVTYTTKTGFKRVFVVLRSEQWQRRSNKVTTRKAASIITHEAMHVWQECLASIGERNPGDEIAAYTVQMLVDWMLGKWLYDDEAYSLS